MFCMIKNLFLYDTLSKEKKVLDISSFTENPLLIYVCGITPYDHSHIGHARCYVTYDILVRLVRFFNSKVTYVQNITDVNDKITQKAIHQYNDPLKYLEVANHYHTLFSDNLQKIGCLKPDFLPRVSTSIPAIIDLISLIMEKGYAYQAEDGVYFNVEKYSSYGALSQRKKIEHNVSRIQEEYHKKNELDFALWKKTDQEPSWSSPWGKGVPGWHIECSAMIDKTFEQKKIHIHGGGADLIFPHHENEKAQSECCRDYALTDIWMHVAFININSTKMSKSLGNCFYIHEIMKRHDPMVFRFYLLMHQYTSPIEFNLDALQGAESSYKQIIKFFNNSNEANSCELATEGNIHILSKMYEFLSDNLNTAALIGFFFKHQEVILKDAFLYKKCKSIFKYILGLSLLPLEIEEAAQYTPQIMQLIEEREQARKAKNFTRADEIKKQLILQGIPINDKKVS